MGKLQQGLDELGWRTFKGPCQEHEVKECRRVLLGEKRVKHHLCGLECGLPGAYGYIYICMYVYITININICF